MASGLDTLSSIDEAVRQVRRDIQDMDQRIRAASDELVSLAREETQQLGALARLRLNQITGGEILVLMDDADRRVAELLDQRKGAVQALEQQVDQSHQRQSRLESDRAAQQQRVNAASEALDRGEAATQKRLADDPEYQAQLERAREADGVAASAEEKAEQAENDRIAKGRQYESDPLFMYLWSRGYGTSRYSANPLIRFLDGYVARLCRFHDARPNYSMLLAIPERLKEHAASVRAESDGQFAALRQLEEKAAEADGVVALRGRLKEEQDRADELDASLREEENAYADLVRRRSEFAGGEDEYSRQCIEVLLTQMRHEPVSQLRREAEETPTAEDNLIVQKLADLARTRQDIESSLAEHKQLHLRHLKRLEELEQLRREFKSRRYDDIHSSFPNGALIGAMLNEFLRGLASSDQLWKTIETQHRGRSIEADPTFGSGGFGHPSGGSWRMPVPGPPGGGGIGRRRGGGRFRTGGGF